MPDNVLEALVLPVTSREINDGRFDSFVAQLRPIKASIQHEIETLRAIFKSVYLVYVNIAAVEDVYGQNLKHTPKYGWASGPNLLFLAAMRHCEKFNTVLLVETDCIVKPTFLEDLSLFTSFSGGFLIAGTHYDGHTYTSAHTLMFHHINGVALYNTGNPRFQNLMRQLDSYIIEQVKFTPFLAYDVAINQLILNRILDKQTHLEWKRIYKDIITTNYFVNMSTKDDKSITMDFVHKYYPNYLILHKK